MSKPRNKIHTYADGFGVWYAEVTIGYPAPSDAINSDSIRASARRAIRREVEARGHVGAGYQFRLEVFKNRLGADNRLYSITYREATLNRFATLEPLTEED